ncbi:hypothetical protein LCGC14_1985050, partial [marine sediment metagenome]
MTKQDYVAIADIIFRNTGLGSRSDNLIQELGNYFASRNVRFDMAKWKL